jgi:GDP-D-mannose 3',5'-epimerase
MLNNSQTFNLDGKILVAGAGGFIGGWLVRDLLSNGFKNIVAVDIKPKSDWYQKFEEVENICINLNSYENCLSVVKNSSLVYNLAADMGGMGFIENNKADCMLSVLINTNLLNASKNVGVERFFFSSSACVYNAQKQKNPVNPGLKEEDAYPAEPEDGYGWEKLFSERLCRHFTEDFSLQTRVARYHNVYGPKGTYEGGREKAPAAICRKIAIAKITGNHDIEIWGDGHQSRSFTYISDTIEGTQLIMHSDYADPLNLGSDELVTINDLVDLVEEVAGIKVIRHYNLNAPKGVRGRNSDNALIESKINWKPTYKLQKGIDQTYKWIYDEIKKKNY